MNINKSEDDTKSAWRNKNPIDKTNTQDKDFPPLPTMKNNIPTHINTHSPTSSVSSMTIEKRTKKIFNKVEEIKKDRNKKDSSETSSAPSHNQLIINKQMNNITTHTITHINTTNKKNNKNRLQTRNPNHNIISILS